MKKGDKVVCVVGYWIPESYKKTLNPLPVKDEIYTILEVRTHEGDLYLALEEKIQLDSDGELEYYQAEGFRKVEPKSLTNDLTKELANKAIKEQVQVERLDVPNRELELA